MDKGKQRMGEWSKWEFGRSQLPEVCILFAGMTPQWQVDNIIGKFDSVSYTKHDNYNPYIVKMGEQEFVLIFQVYGAAMVADLLTILKDGNIKKIWFMGAAYGIKDDCKVGDFVVPEEVQCLDGVTGIIGNVKFSSPDLGQLNEIRNIFKNEENVHYGKTISVPTTFHHPDEKLYIENAVALEMEFSSLCYFSNKAGIRAAGIFVISDTKNKDLLMDQSLRYGNMFKAFEIILSFHILPN